MESSVVRMGIILNELALILPTRDGKMGGGSQNVYRVVALILPTRDGKDPLIALVDAGVLGFDPTYKGWKAQ